MLNFIREKLSGSVTWMVSFLLVAVSTIIGGSAIVGAIGEGSCVNGLPVQVATCETAAMSSALAGSLLWKVATIVCGGITVMFTVRLFFWIKSLSIFQSATLTKIFDDGKSAAQFLGCVFIGLCFITGSVLAQPPSPAAWPEPVVTEDTNVRLPARFSACEPYRDDIEDAVNTYWPDWLYPDAWAAQLYQESLCDRTAVSPVGARGIAQFMPGTWAEAQERFGVTMSPHSDIAIQAGAWYMRRQMNIWSAPRSRFSRWQLSLASYNAGAGNIIRAQSECNGARDWDDILPCLPDVTGHHALETTQYVVRIQHHWQAMSGDDLFALPPELRS